MIILKHLTVERFRLLREINLHFPQRGSILIQGPNEAGKSALLESIYFALYGESLTTGRSLDELISYGATSATVTLSLSIGATDLTITRTIERGKGLNVCLLVQRLGMPEEEPITRFGTANKRIISELGRMDGEALRNSCLVEQKGLERLEYLRGAERENSARKLLGLEKLIHLTEHFQVTPNDEKKLKECSERLRLAEIQARIPELSKQLDSVEAALDAVQVAEALDEIKQQEEDIFQQEQTLKQTKTRRLALKNQQVRIQHLKRADATLADIISAYEGIADARHEIPEIEKQIADLERREREELPALERRVSDLGDLLRSFGTLQRMSNDLLTSAETIKDLERELKQHDAVKGDLKSLEGEVAYARARLQEALQALQELEERRRSGRPSLEARVERLRTLVERLATVRVVEERYLRRLGSSARVEENAAQINKIQKDLLTSEHELELVEVGARQAQIQADALEKRWRQLAIRRQLERWQHLEEHAQNLAQAEQHVRATYQQQERLNLAAMEAHGAVTRYKIIFVACIALLLVSLIIVGFEVIQGTAVSLIVASVAGLAALLLIAGAWLSYHNFDRSRKEKQEADKLVQEAISKVATMVAARESALRISGDNTARQSIEYEIHSLGGTVPRSLEEAQNIISQTQDHGESLADLQQQAKLRREEANAAREQVNVVMEAVTRQRNERARLQELRRNEDWDNIKQNLHSDQETLERLYQEVTLLAGQEGLPLPTVSDLLQGTAAFGTFGSNSGLHDEDTAGIPELESQVQDLIKDTEREIAALDGKMDLVADFAAQVQVHQDALDVLLTRQKVIEERNTRYQTSNPALQVERAREQQSVLRQALQSLQDSLRQRVKPLGVAFGQATISNAEATAHKQLEELHINLGNKYTLQEHLTSRIAQLKELQESLAEHYKQLAKFSNSLGSWIVPPKPFAEVLATLRARCQREIEEANEAGIARELETLQNREGAAKAKTELCHQEIEEAQERIAGLLKVRSRPLPRTYKPADLATVWPLLKEYTIEGRSHLEEDRIRIEKDLDDLEQQELMLSKQLQIGDVKLDLAQARLQKEQQEHSYQIRKRGHQLTRAVDLRLMHKILPCTERHMQQILPLLTSGRYHDVHLRAEEEKGTISGGPYQIHVWDTAAAEYVSKSALSGGAANQLSLALRLAFAIAILPRELNTAPGFILLDEPLSSFDRGRTQALVNVVTGKALSQHFEQVILISHSNAFDPTMFPYHVYMDNGMIVESNLPVVSVIIPTETNSDDDDGGDDVVATRLRIPAV